MSLTCSPVPVPTPPHSDQYYTNKSSMPSMQNVLVLTMPNTRNYTVNNNFSSSSMVRKWRHTPVVVTVGPAPRPWRAMDRCA